MKRFKSSSYVQHVTFNERIVVSRVMLSFSYQTKEHEREFCDKFLLGVSIGFLFILGWQVT
jgi:hypothetical protein